MLTLDEIKKVYYKEIPFGILSDMLEEYFTNATFLQNKLKSLKQNRIAIIFALFEQAASRELRKKYWKIVRDVRKAQKKHHRLTLDSCKFHAVMKLFND